jgi:DNA-binding IclR family transcriptional regulator
MKSANADTQRVPALQRGIALHRALERRGEATLDTLAAECHIPKASALRLLRTLVDLGMAHRNPSTRTYRPAMRLVPLTSPGIDFARRVADALEHLARSTGYTAEWYVQAPEGMVLTRRHEPESQQVHVVAQIGFVRTLDGELDAVAAAALAAGVAELAPKARYWSYGQDGIRTMLSRPQARHIVAETFTRGFSFDPHFNTNGVKRVAVAVMAGAAAAGILSLAHGYQPGNRIDYHSLAGVLSNTAQTLSSSTRSTP